MCVFESDALLAAAMVAIVKLVVFFQAKGRISDVCVWGGVLHSMHMISADPVQKLHETTVCVCVHDAAKRVRLFCYPCGPTFK